MNYEYKCLDFKAPPDKITDFLNEQASQGWHFLQAIDIRGYGELSYYFRREVKLTLDQEQARKKHWSELKEYMDQQYENFENKK